MSPHLDLTRDEAEAIQSVEARVAEVRQAELAGLTGNPSASAALDIAPQDLVQSVLDEHATGQIATGSEESD